MKNYLTLSILLLTAVTSQCFGWMGPVSTDCHGINDPYKNNVQYNVYQGTPTRNGYENTSPGYVDRSETYGDTTYHTLSPIPTRRGYGN